jgi:HEAT repeats
MSSHYSNLVLLGPKREDIVDALTALGRVAFISPTVGQMTIIYDEECDSLRPGVASKVARQLSSELDCVALAATNCESRQLHLILVKSGVIRGEYLIEADFTGTKASNLTQPESFGAELCAAFHIDRRTGHPHDQFFGLLDGKFATSADEAHCLLCDAIRLPSDNAIGGFANVEDDPYFRPAGTIHVGSSKLPLSVEASEDEEPERLVRGKTLSAWISQLRNGKASDRWYAANTLAYFCGKSKAIVEALAGATNDRDSRYLVRAQAANGLGRLGVEPEVAVPSLVALLHDEIPEVRASAAESLGEFRGAASSSVDAVETLVHDETMHQMGEDMLFPMKYTAAIALTRITGDADRWHQLVSAGIRLLQKEGHFLGQKLLEEPVIAQCVNGVE